MKVGKESRKDWRVRLRLPSGYPVAENHTITEYLLHLALTARERLQANTLCRGLNPVFSEYGETEATLSFYLQQVGRSDNLPVDCRVLARVGSRRDRAG